MVGRVGVEPTTSRLSGVRSNHLSYRPPMPNLAGHIGRRRREPAQASTSRKTARIRHKPEQTNPRDAVSSDEGT
jgi:hypothetical protein